MAAITDHDNQAGIDLVSPPSTWGANAVKVFEVPLLRATVANLEDMGRPVRDFATEKLDITPFPLQGRRKLVTGTGIEGGFVEDVFQNERKGGVQYSVNVGLGRRYIIGWYGSDPALAAAAATEGGSDPAAAVSLDSILTHEANYHPDGGQIICSRDGSPFVLLLAPAGDDVQPESFRAFLVDPAFDGTTGIHINAYTWHQPAFPANTVSKAAGAGAGEAAMVLNNRQGRVHGCVSCSFLHEFGGYLRVPLTAAAVLDDAAAAALPKPSSTKVNTHPRFGYTILYVPDVERAIDFYCSAFGMTKKFVVSTPVGTYGELLIDAGSVGGAVLSFASEALARSNFAPAVATSDSSNTSSFAPVGACDFVPASAAARPPPMEIGLVVPSVPAALARALAAGATLVAPVKVKPWGQEVAYVRDGDGFIVELCSAMG